MVSSAAEKSFDKSNKFVKEINKDFKKLMKKLKSKKSDVRDDAMTVKALKLMLETTVAMIPVAAKAYHKYPGQNGAYSYTALVTKAMEIMDATRSVTDLKAQVDHIQHNIVESSMKMMLQQMADELYELKRWGKLELDKKASKRLGVKADAILSNYGAFMNEMVNKVNNDLTEYMVE